MSDNLKAKVLINGKDIGNYEITSADHNIPIPLTRWQRILSWFGLYKQRHETVKWNFVEIPPNSAPVGSTIGLLYESIYAPVSTANPSDKKPMFSFEFGAPPFDIVGTAIIDDENLKLLIGGSEATEE